MTSQAAHHDGEPGIRHVRRARVALAVVFCAHGCVTGSFATRVPWIQDHTGIGAGQLGLALAFPALGSLLAMPLAGTVAHRLGSRAALRVLLSAWTLSLALPSLAPNLYTLCAALFVYGASSGMSDVVMNGIGVETENRLGRSIMSGLHGMWSGGALLGSAFGALAANLGAGAPLHHELAAAVLTAVGLLACGGVLDVRSAPEAQAPPRFALPPRAALLIGLVGFCAVFGEGASLDWSAVYLRDVLSTSAGLAAASTTAFSLTMAVTRIAGDRLVDRFGPVRTVRAGGVFATAGGALVVLAPRPEIAMGGFALLGVGVAIVVPLAFAAAGRSGSNPNQAIAGVATITYTSGLVAPSVIGGVAHASSLQAAFGLVTLLAAGLLAGAGVLRPRPRAGGDRLGGGGADGANPAAGTAGTDGAPANGPRPGRTGHAGP
ncbi:MFS transporter [Streptomyces sp. NRRL F-5126]|uniref:MFS transporter n=1 Tax=Streptomyces sp. NRRL F-5126 TaxID=1463857 RepID=UPI0004C698B2|nr:MFS transporter [Streptomyces sp. NRRL F-5126]